MKIATDEWKIHSRYLLLFFGAILLVVLLVLWFVSLGHINLLSRWWGRMTELEDDIDYMACQYRIKVRREEAQDANQ